MARKADTSAVLDLPKSTQKTVGEVTLPIPYSGRKCPKLFPADFWRATAAYPRNAVTCFKVYRLFPVIDRKLVGEELKDICDRPEVTEAGILSEFGAGEYQVYFIDGNHKPSSLCSTVLEFGDIWANPPVLNQQELVEGHPKNKGYIEGLKARGLWKRDTQEDQTAMAEAAANTGAAAAAVSEMGAIAKRAMDRSGEKQPADVALGEAVGIMSTAYKSALATIGDSAGNKGGDSAMVALLIKQMEANEARAERQAKESEARAQRQHEAMLEMMKNQRPAAGMSIESQFGLVDKMLEFGKRLGSDGGGGSRSWTDRLPDLAVPLLTALMSRAAAAPAAPQFPQYAEASYVPAASAPPASAPVAPVHAAPPVPAESQENEAMMPLLLAQMGVPSEAIPFARTLLKVAGRAVQMFKAGVSGYAFAADVERTDGEDAYGDLWRMGTAEVADFLAQFGPLLGPENSAMVASAPFQSWLTDFFAYGEANGYTVEDVPAGGEGAAK